MPSWSPDAINRKSSRDFESTWLETGELVKRRGREFRQDRRKGSAHPVEEVRQKVRKVLLSLGFDEAITPLIWEDEHVRRQYGPESAVILDRCYYLAGLPRPEIGLSKMKLAQIRKIVPGFSAVDTLRGLLRDYKTGRVESDDFVEEMVNRLGIAEEKATEIIDKVFGEMKKLIPLPTKLTVLSHFTTAWFPILSSSLSKKICPILLFTTGVRMRREQREDATHLRSHCNASLVIMAKRLTLEDGRSMAKRILRKLRLDDVEFVPKRATSKYYAPGTEEEVFAEYGPAGEGRKIEIADLGMYSPVALARYGIPYPVFNMGLSIGRLAMIENDVADIREITYPEIYRPPSFSDQEMELSLRPISPPRTREGRATSAGIVEAAWLHADAEAPCSFKAWEGRIRGGSRCLVELTENEDGVRLVGPAAFNTIVVEEGNILSRAPNGARPEGRLTYIKCFADHCASFVEERARSRRPQRGEIRVGMVRSASDIFLDIPIVVRRYIESNNKKIDIRGPMFTTVRYEVL